MGPKGERVAEGTVVLMIPGNAGGGKGPHYLSNSFNNTGGRDEMIKASISLQDLRRRIYNKAKSEPEWRFWGLYVHVYRYWVMKSVRRHLQRARGRSGFGWKRWSSAYIYGQLGLYYGYKLKRYEPAVKPA